MDASRVRVHERKIYKYFSPVIRGIENGPLRVTSVAMTNTPAINHLDALAASANLTPSDRSDKSGRSDRKESMGKLESALGRLLGRDNLALSGETSNEEKDKIACEIEEKASLIEQVKKLLKLAPEATLDEVIAALKAETEKPQAPTKSRRSSTRWPPVRNSRRMPIWSQRAALSGRLSTRIWSISTASTAKP